MACKQFKGINLEQPYFFHKLQVQSIAEIGQPFGSLEMIFNVCKTNNQTRS
jgi:hypothetical protein